MNAAARSAVLGLRARPGAPMPGLLAILRRTVRRIHIAHGRAGGHGWKAEITLAMLAFRGPDKVRAYVTCCAYATYSVRSRASSTARVGFSAQFSTAPMKSRTANALAI